MTLLEVATLDKTLYEVMKLAYDSVAELEHIRESLIYYVVEDRTHLDGFISYALRELDGAYENLDAL